MFGLFVILVAVLNPTRCPKGFLEAVRLISSHQEPVPSHGDLFYIVLYWFVRFLSKHFSKSGGGGGVLGAQGADRI